MRQQLVIIICQFKIKYNISIYIIIQIQIMQGIEKEQGALRHADKSPVKVQQQESVPTSRIAPSNEGGMTSRLAGSLPVSPPGGGQVSPRAPLNMQFHNENIMAFLEKQKKRLQQLVFPQGQDAALNKAWQKYQQPLSAVDGHGKEEKHHHDHKQQEQPQHQHGPGQAHGSQPNLQVPSQGDHSGQASESGAKQPNIGEKAKQDPEDDESGRFDQNLAALYEALSLLIKILKFHQKIQRLSVGQLLQLSNKMRVDTTAVMARGNQQATAALSARTIKNMEESVQTGESQVENDAQNAEQNKAHELPNENIDMSIFDLSSEHILMGMEAPEEDELGTGNANSQRESREQKSLTRKSFRHVPDVPPQPNLYKQSYFKARKLFVSLRKQNDEMRQEQIHYIIGSLKLLVVFLKVSAALDLHRTSPNQLKYIRFLISLETRLKMTSFVLIQRLSDEEKMNRIAKEALDTHVLSDKAEQIEKKRLQAQQNSDKNGVGAAVERLKQLAKEAKKRADARKLFDQNDADISIVDSLLFNKFSLSNLCKLKLDFLAILHIKKQFMQQNFDEHTRVELQRFENQKQTSMLLNEFLEDAKRSHHNLKLLGMYDAPKRDPVKIYFEMSVKNLILGNRLTGPALAGDPGFAALLQKYYCSQVLLDRDPRQIHFADEEINFSPIMEKLGTPEEIKVEFARLGRTEPLQNGASGMLSRNFPPPAENKSTNFTKNLTSQQHSDLTGSAETSSPSRLVPSPLPPDLGLHGAKSDQMQDQRIEVMINVPSALLDGAMHASTGQDQTGYFNRTQTANLMQISNPVISSDLLVQSLGKHSFGVQLPQNIEGLFKIGLLSVAGRQPPQVQWALNAKSSALQRKQLKDLSKNKKVHGRVTQRGLDLDQSDYLGAIDYKAVEEAQNQDLEGCRSEENQEAPEQDLREPDAGQEESARHRGNNANSQAAHEPSFGRLKSSMGSWATSKPQSYRDGAANQARTTGTPMTHNEQLKSSSLCTQDLVLLTDFVTLPELVAVFCQAQQEFSGINVKNLYSTEPALMTLERIEDYLLKTGKNELYLKHEGRYVQGSYPAPLTQKRTKFQYVQALHPADFSMFQPHGYGPEPLHMHADQDLLLTLLLTSLFNIKSLGQREVPDAGEVELEGQLGSEPRIRRFVEVEAMESVEERTMTWSKGSSLAVNTISQTVLMTQFYLNSHVSADELLEPLKSAAKRGDDHAKHTDLDEQDIEFFDQDQDKAVNTGGAKLNLIYVLNQLIIHQTLARLKFEHQAIYIPEIAKLFYRNVLGIHRLYAQTFIELIECDDPNAFGSYAMMNSLSGPSTIQKKLLLMDEGAEHTQKYLFLPYSYDRPQKFEMALEQLRHSNQSPREVAPAERTEGEQQQVQVQVPMVPYQDFLENPHIDQERRVVDADQRGDQYDEVVDLQVQQIREAKQRFLQKLANQIQRDHIENEKLHFLVKKHLVEESSTIWNGPLEPEKEEEQKGHHATRASSFLPGSIGGPNDGKQVSHDANQNMAGGPRLDSTGSPQHVPPTPGTKMPLSAASINQPPHHNKGGGSGHKMPTAESGGSQGTLQRGEPKPNPKAKFLGGTGPSSSDSQSNKVALQYRDIFKIEEAERARLLRVLRKQGVVGSSPGKRLTEEQRMVELEKIERKGLQDILKKSIIEAEYHLEVWYYDTLARVTNETKTFFLGGELNQIEELLYACDLELLKQRKVLVTMLKSVEHGMDDREYSIREQLRQIAILEMQKGKDEDEMLDQTLKAIEIDVHIADIAVEKERLTSINKNLLAKQTELEKQVDELDDTRRRKGRSGAALSPRKQAMRDSGNPDVGSATQKKDSAGRGQTASPKDLASIIVPGAPFEHPQRQGEKSPSVASAMSDD